MPKGKTVGTPTKKKAAPYQSKTEKGTVGVAKKVTAKPFIGAATKKQVAGATDGWPRPVKKKKPRRGGKGGR
jgi:hypothetical protein